MPIPNSLWIAKDGNKHSIQKQGWSPGEKAKEPQWRAELLALKACLKTMMPKTQPGHSDLSLRLVDLQFSLPTFTQSKNTGKTSWGFLETAFQRAELCQQKAYVSLSMDQDVVWM